MRRPSAKLGISIPVSALKSPPTKRFTGTGQHHDAQIGVIVKIAAECHHFMMHAIVDGVHFLRPIKLHNDNTIVTAVNGHTLVIFLFQHGSPKFPIVCPQQRHWCKSKAIDLLVQTGGTRHINGMENGKNLKNRNGAAEPDSRGSGRQCALAYSLPRVMPM